MLLARRHASSVADHPSLGIACFGPVVQLCYAKNYSPGSFALFFLLLIPVFAQCNDQFANRIVGPNVLIEEAVIPCQMSLWANNVPLTGREIHFENTAY